MPQTILLATVISFLAALTVDARICLIHETVAQSGKNEDGKFHQSNFTIVKVHNCPIYTQCCDAVTACCFDNSWFWSTMGVILFLLFLGSSMSLYGRFKKKHRTGDAGVSSPPVVSGCSFAAHGSGHGQRSPGQLPTVCPKPPSYMRAASLTTPQPGNAHTRLFLDDAPPPPYTAVINTAKYNSVHTQTTTV